MHPWKSGTSRPGAQWTHRCGTATGPGLRGRKTRLLFYIVHKRAARRETGATPFAHTGEPWRYGLRVRWVAPRSAWPPRLDTLSGPNSLTRAGGRRRRRRQPLCPRHYPTSFGPRRSSPVCGNLKPSFSRIPAAARCTRACDGPLPRPCLSSALSCATREPPLSVHLVWFRRPGCASLPLPASVPRPPSPSAAQALRIGFIAPREPSRAGSARADRTQASYPRRRGGPGDNGRFPRGREC
jgi:hypothetical protein